MVHYLVISIEPNDHTYWIGPWHHSIQADAAREVAKTMGLDAWIESNEDDLALPKEGKQLLAGALDIVEHYTDSGHLWQDMKELELEKEKEGNSNVD